MKKNVALSAVKNRRAPEDLISDLRQLGFTEYEARTYLTLLVDYPATAYEVAKAAGLPRANVYSALDGLEKKGAVQPISESPVRYVPVDPKVTLDVIARSTSSLCTEVADRLASLSPTKTRDYVWTLSGEDNIHRRISEILNTAEKHIWIKAHQHALGGHIEELRAAAERGVRLLIILFREGSEQRLDLGPSAEVYLHEGTGVVVGLGQSLITVTADFQIALTANLGSEAFGALTQSRPVVNLAESLIRHEVYLAEIFAHFGDSVTERFGPFMQQLRRKYLPGEQVAQLDRVIAGIPVDTKSLQARGALPTRKAGDAR